MDKVIRNIVVATRPGRNNTLNDVTWTLGHCIAAADALYAAAERNGLVSEDGERQTWATIRSGLGAGLNLSANARSPEYGQH